MVGGRDHVGDSGHLQSSVYMQHGLGCYVSQKKKPPWTELTCHCLFRLGTRCL